MRPPDTANDGTNGGLCDAKLQAKFTLTDPLRTVTSADVGDVLVGQSRVVVSFAECSCRAALAVTVAIVITAGSCEQMPWVTASGVVAMMEDAQGGLIEVGMAQQIGEPGSTPLSRPHLECAVAVIEEGPSPRPAFIWTMHGDVAPEVCGRVLHSGLTVREI